MPDGPYPHSMAPALQIYLEIVRTRQRPWHLAASTCGFVYLPWKSFCPALAIVPYYGVQASSDLKENSSGLKNRMGYKLPLWGHRQGEQAPTRPYNLACVQPGIW